LSPETGGLSAYPETIKEQSIYPMGLQSALNVYLSNFDFLFLYLNLTDVQFAFQSDVCTKGEQIFFIILISVY